MQFWINFWNLLFWFSLIGFIINSTNFLNLFLYSEITWLTLYNYSIFVGISIDELTLLSTSFFILALAGLEFAIGFLLILLFKTIGAPTIFLNAHTTHLTLTTKKSQTNINSSFNFF